MDSPYPSQSTYRRRIRQAEELRRVRGNYSVLIRLRHAVRAVV